MRMEEFGDKFSGNRQTREKAKNFLTAFTTGAKRPIFTEPALR